MNTWYKIEGCYTKEISAVEVEKFTEKTVTLVGGRRQNRMSDYHSFYPTLDEAVAVVRGFYQHKKEYHEAEAASYVKRAASLEAAVTAGTVVKAPFVPKGKLVL